MEDEFYDACKTGDLDKAKKLHMNGVDTTGHGNYAFRVACYYGHKHIVEWLVDHCADIHVEHDYGIYIALYEGHIELAKYLNSIGLNLKNYCDVMSFDTMIRKYLTLDYYPKIIEYLIETNQFINYDNVLRRVLIEAIEDKHVSLAKLILKQECFNTQNQIYIEKIKMADTSWIDSNKMDQQLIECCDNVEFDKAHLILNKMIHNSFIKVCKSGDIDKAKELIKYNVDIHMDDDLPFRYACKYGHLILAKWLVSLGGVNIHAKKDNAFIRASQNGHLDIVKWLYNYSKNYDAENKSDDAMMFELLGFFFESMNKKGNARIFDKHPFEYVAKNIAFMFACKSGHLDVAKYLYSTNNIDIYLLDESSIVKAFENGHYDVAMWLYSLYKENDEYYTFDLDLYANSSFEKQYIYNVFSRIKKMVGKTNNKMYLQELTNVFKMKQLYMDPLFEELFQVYGIMTFLIY